ncbi:hypothetical protein [Peribacillus kribbensis]|uniref:hypothetical protein n=1 Tax=Peribacillus kribbensis TaxID=356658 RepID=UPI000409726F|nr:hypothetical protein [Peribacillus kribbensis]
MFLKLLRILDSVNIFFGLLTAVLLIAFHSIWIDSIAIILSAALLWKTKYDNRRTLLFLAYFISSWYLASLLTSPLLLETIHVRSLPYQPLCVLGIALLIGLIAAAFLFGTSTLTFIWLVLYLLAAAEALLSSPGSFLSNYWTGAQMSDTIHQFYPVLIAVIFIGIYLEKFQKAMVLDYLANK